MDPGDLDRELQQECQRQTERQHGERVLSGGGDRREGEHSEDHAAPPGLELLVAEHPDGVEHDDQQREFEADAEHQQQVDQEAEVLVAGQRGHLHVASHGQQEVQRLGQHHVGQDGARDEQGGGRDHERHREAAFALVQPRCDERPELVKPHRAGQHDAGRQSHFEPQHELVERRRRQQPAATVCADVGARRRRQRAIRAPKPLAEALHPEQAVAIPDEPDDRGQRHRTHRDQQPGPQFPDMLDKGHGPVGIGTAAPRTGVQAGQEFRRLHGVYPAPRGRCCTGLLRPAGSEPVGRAGREEPESPEPRPARSSPAWAGRE